MIARALAELIVVACRCPLVNAGSSLGSPRAALRIKPQDLSLEPFNQSVLHIEAIHEAVAQGKQSACGRVCGSPAYVRPAAYPAMSPS